MGEKQPESAVTWENLISKLSMQYLKKVFNKRRQTGVGPVSVSPGSWDEVVLVAGEAVWKSEQE